MPETRAATGSNDKTWDDITEDHAFQVLLAGLFNANSRTHTEEFMAAGKAVQDWIEHNIVGCSAEVDHGVRYRSNGSGDPPSYCDEVVSPGCGEFCMSHKEDC